MARGDGYGWGSYPGSAQEIDSRVGEPQVRPGNKLQGGGIPGSLREIGSRIVELPSPRGRVGMGSSDPTNDDDDDDDDEGDVEVGVDGDEKRWRRDSLST